MIYISVSAKSFSFHTGCLKILAEKAQSDNVRWSLPAKRALHNLDRESGSPILPPGIYQLSPDFGYDEKGLKCDIVFVHGLLGGVFRTWRRQDLDPCMFLLLA